MLIDTPISLGELVDKISILIIKQKNINDEEKLKHINKELEFLQSTLLKHIKKDDIKKYVAPPKKLFQAASEQIQEVQLQCPLKIQPLKEFKKKQVYW